MARLAVLALALGLLGACSEPKPAEQLPVPASASAEPPFDPIASARRPPRRYFLGNTGSRCEIYFVDPGSLSPPVVTPCPQDLLPGERIRIAGKTCTRDTEDFERRLPVVCPDPLTDFEKRDRGEIKAK